MDKPQSNAMFINKLYSQVSKENLTIRLLSLKEYEPILSWIDSGTAFEVKQPDRFAAEVLPKFFNHSKMTSFVRQLNIYGFQRLSQTKGGNSCSFTHPCFLKSEPGLLSLIRRNAAKKEVSTVQMEEDVDTSALYQSLDSVQARNQGLLEDLSKLGRMMQEGRWRINQLADELTTHGNHILQLNDALFPPLQRAPSNVRILSTTASMRRFNSIDSNLSDLENAWFDPSRSPAIMGRPRSRKLSVGI